MRDRLVAILVAMTVGTVLLYGIPRAYILADLVQDHELRQVERSLDLAAVAVTARSEEPADVTADWLAQLLHEGESIEVVAPDGSRVQAGLPEQERTAEDLVLTRTLPDGSELALRRSGELVEDQVSRALLPLVLIGLGLALAAALVARLLAAHLARPFRELAGVADAIAEGRFDVDVPHYRVAEAEAVGSALRRGAGRMAELRRRERDVAANASHELRTPISALRLQIEDLASWPETPPAVATELTSYLPELDRLSAAVRSYLDTAQAGRLTDVDVVDLAAVTRQVLERRRGAPVTGAQPVPTTIVVDEPAGPLLVRASAATVADVLGHLLTDASRRGAARVLVEVVATDDYGQLRLELEGPLGPPETGARDAAARTALAVDGRLSVQDRHSTLVLRRAADPAHAEGPSRIR